MGELSLSSSRTSPFLPYQEEGKKRESQSYSIPFRSNVLEGGGT